ncbi:MAG: hypothetical protein EA363_01395 [Balneolaceae bacterium]|nr:MAG: hypothetical protein EA363_01395 [Balneolaceae bacterium]
MRAIFSLDPNPLASIRAEKVFQVFESPEMVTLFLMTRLDTRIVTALLARDSKDATYEFSLLRAIV